MTHVENRGKGGCHLSEIQILITRFSWFSSILRRAHDVDERVTISMSRVMVKLEALLLIAVLSAWGWSFWREDSLSYTQSAFQIPDGGTYQRTVRARSSAGGLSFEVYAAEYFGPGSSRWRPGRGHDTGSELVARPAGVTWTIGAEPAYPAQQSVAPWITRAPTVLQKLGFFSTRTGITDGRDNERWRSLTVPYWSLFSLAHLPCVPMILFAFRSRRSRNQGRCAFCGYDLRATPNRCPECGNPA